MVLYNDVGYFQCYSRSGRGFMYRFLYLLLLFGFVSAVQSADIAESSVPSIAPFPPEVSRELVEAWLRLHDEELCLGIDAVFVPDGGGIQVWSLTKDEKRHKKLLKILQPLAGSGRVEIFAAEPVSPDHSDEDGAPPSLWENDELRTFYRIPRRSDQGINPATPLSVIPREDIYEQRLIIFANQTLERSENLRRYAKDLPALSHVALNHAYDSDLRLLAFKICREHARGMEKLIGRLNNILKYAIPRGKETKEAQPQDVQDGEWEDSLMKLAVRIAGNTDDIAQQVYTFIYPDSHTVELDELQSPGILNALRMLRELNEIYMGKISQESEKYKHTL